MGGQVPVMFLDLASGLSVIRGGGLRPLAIGTARRSPLLPEVPTLADAGVVDVEVFDLHGLVGPAGLPPAAGLPLSEGSGPEAGRHRPRAVRQLQLPVMTAGRGCTPAAARCSLGVQP
jgi:hypothetical protein